MLLATLPGHVGSVLDLGCGDGLLADLVGKAHPKVDRIVGVDLSSSMIARARERFAGDSRVELSVHDLAEPITGFGMSDAIVSGFAIHHLADSRKRELFTHSHTSWSES